MVQKRKDDERKTNEDVEYQWVYHKINQLICHTAEQGKFTVRMYTKRGIFPYVSRTVMNRVLDVVRTYGYTVNISNDDTVDIEWGGGDENNETQ